MGKFFSIFWRPKHANQQLIELSESYKKLDVHRRKLLARKEWLARHTLRLVLAIVVLIAAYLYALPPVSKLLYSILVVIVIFSIPIVLLLRRAIDHYYARALTNNFLKHKEIDDKIKTKLEEVLDVCSFKEAKRLIETYAPQHSARIFGSISVKPDGSNALVVKSALTPQPRAPINSRSTSSTALSPMVRPPSVPVQPTPFAVAQRGPPRTSQGVTQSSFMERLTGYLIGDADTSRYALICTFCYHNNGLALAEEFQYTSFRCISCSCLNEARAVRPAGPKLSQMLPTTRESTPTPRIDNDEGEKSERSEPDQTSSDEGERSSADSARSEPQLSSSEEGADKAAISEPMDVDQSIDKKAEDECKPIENTNADST